MTSSQIQKNIYDIATSMEPFHVVGFAGGGGSSQAYKNAGHRVSVALNHDPKAVSMHRMNHPEAEHFLEDIRDVDPLVACQGRCPDSAWFSPDCRDFSKAKGGKPKSKRVRGLAWVIIHWVNRIKAAHGRGPRVIFLENVEEFQQWCQLLPDGRRNPALKGHFFRCFVGALRRRGYEVQWEEQRACDYDAATIRKRLFLVARNDGRPIVWHERTRAEAGSIEVTGGKLPAYATTAQCLDFTQPCPSIFLTKKQARVIGCKRPLAHATLARIAKGIERYVLKSPSPFIVNLTHQGNDGVEGIDDPIKTVTGANRGEKALVSPVLAGLGGRAAQSRPRSGNEPMATITAKADSALITARLAAPFVTEHANGSHQRNFPADQPLRTTCAGVKGGHFAAVAATLVRTAHGEKDRNGKKRGRGAMDVREPLPSTLGTRDVALASVHLTKFCTGSVGSGADEPMPTITSNSFKKRPGGNPPLGVCAAFLAQHNGGMVGHDAREPMSTINSKAANQALVGATVVPYYGSERDGCGVHDPVRTVTVRERFGLAEAFGALPVLTPELERKARVVARFLRRFGVKFKGPYAMVGEFVIVDIGMRMLLARELYRAQGFPDSYIIDRGMVQTGSGAWIEVLLTKTEQVRMVGNSVSPLHAEKIILANLGRGSAWEKAA